MPYRYKTVVDCQDPHLLARFWAAALDWPVEDHSRLIHGLRAAGHVGDEDVMEVDGVPSWRIAAAVRDPDGSVDEHSGVGLGGRVLFQVVPEAKTVKNRVHLDVHVGDGREEHVRRLEALGARRLGEGDENGARWVVLADPEGNEFCVA